MVKQLTPREEEVGALLVQGYSNPSIAEHLAISKFTVKTHISAICLKLGIGTNGKWNPRCRAAYLLRRSQVARLLADPTDVGEALLLLAGRLKT